MEDEWETSKRKANKMKTRRGERKERVKEGGGEEEGGGGGRQKTIYVRETGKIAFLGRNVWLWLKRRID